MLHKEAYMIVLFTAFKPVVMTFQGFLNDCSAYKIVKIKENWSLTLWADDSICDGTDDSSIFPHTIIDTWDIPSGDQDIATHPYSKNESSISLYHTILHSAAAVTRCTKRRGREELPHVRGQRQRPRVPGCHGAGTAERSYPSPRSVAAGRRHPTSEVRGGGQEELPNVHGQWRLGEATLLLRPGAAAGRSIPRSGGCTGAGGPRGAIPRWR